MFLVNLVNYSALSSKMFKKHFSQQPTMEARRAAVTPRELDESMLGADLFWFVSFVSCLVCLGYWILLVF